MGRALRIQLTDAFYHLAGRPDLCPCLSSDPVRSGQNKSILIAKEPRADLTPYLATLAKDYPDAAPLIGRRESEGMVKEREFRQGMQSQCEYQQDHLCDPDGILLDVRAQDN